MSRPRKTRQDNNTGVSASLNSASQSRQQFPVPPNAGSSPRFGRDAPLGATQPISPAENGGRRRSYTANSVHHQHQPNSNIPLPSAWNITDPGLRHSSKLGVTLKGVHNATVVADRPIPTVMLQEGAGKSVANSQPSPGRLNSHLHSGNARSSSDVYYFEIKILAGSSSSSSDSLEVQIGLVCADESTVGIVPGDDLNSIGWGSDGLKVNGRLYDTMITSFKPGDVIGCGIEILGMQRVFFTRNGTILVPPSPNTSFLGGNDRPCFPALGFRNGNSSAVRANFGLDTLIPFRWMGSNRLSIVAQQTALITLTSSISAALPVTSPLVYGKLRSESEGNKSAKRSPSPYYGTAELDTLDDPFLSDPMSVTNPNLTRSVSRPNPASLVVPQLRTPKTPPRARSSHLTPPGGPLAAPSSASPAYFGTKNTRKSLEDDDPADNNATTSAHFTLPGSNAGSMTGTRSSPYGQQSVGSSAGVPSGDGQWGHTIESPPERKPPPKLASGPHQSPLSTQTSGRSNTKAGRIKITDTKSPSFDARAYRSTSPRDDDGDRKQPPRSKSPPHRNLLNPYETTPDSAERLDSSSSPVAAAVASGDVTAIAKENYKTLLLAAGDKKVEYSYIQELLSICIADQETLKRKLSAALEDGDLVDNLEELFSVNDGICSAIEAGEKYLKTATKKTTKKKPVEGPTIELLVDNEDVFSLICMLRAQNEKRLAAALALMKFARESEPLRDEIRSSGGMHSFLTLFRTNGMARELQVVASLAVAYVLPSFVVSSQTTCALGLKIIECLRFLVASRPVTPQGVSISREEMCKVAAIGVNILWINAVLPLLKCELSKNDARKTEPVLTRVRTSVYVRSTRGQLGGGVFDQGQDSVDIKELTELAVTLITHIAKLAHNENLNIDMGYNIVEQVCEVDVARPIAVREGLLRILVDWIRSKDIERVRPAASALRYLISIEDKYMAGWIHSQVVNEGAVKEIVKLLNESVGHDVRVAVAQMLAALCVAPHTRAAVVEARCVSYLIALLYEHNSPASEKMVQYAGSALLQLAAGAMCRTSANSLVLSDSATLDDQDSLITEIVDGWAHGSFIQIAMEHKGKLRSIAVEALRVLSEDTDPKRQTRLHLCSAGAAEALGKTLKDDVPKISMLKCPEKVDASIHDPDGTFYNAVKEIHEALCALANILEPAKTLSKSRQNKQLLQSHFPNPKETLIKGCVDTAESGGLKSLIWISSLPYTQSTETNLMTVDRMDLIEEACRLLASLSPLLLSDIAASKGCARWANEVFEALDGILRRLTDSEDNLSDTTNELNIDALRGLGALARYEPLKIQIVERSLPNLLMLKNLSGDKTDVSNAASQVLLSLGFTEDEITVQVAGNNPKLLVDWFCLQRALTIQAMARAEIRTVVDNMWRLPYSDVTDKSAMKLIRQLSGASRKSSDESLNENDSMNELFEHYTNDEDSIDQRASLLKQYGDIYGLEDTKSFLAPARTSSNDFVLGVADDTSLMSRHVFPLNATSTEKEWVLSHMRMLQIDGSSEMQSSAEILPERIEKLLESCFPSKLLRNDVIPLHDLRPDAAFNFRALMMPQRRYFSFRREGQLLSRLCEKQAAASDCDDVHWTLGFTNSTFAGEFVESLNQTLYLCPMITGLTFVRNPEWLAMRDSDSENEGDEGGALLVDLSGSLPPWVSYLTFDNVLNDRDLRALAAIIETMGKLSAGQDLSDHAKLLAAGGDDISGQSQGKFNSFSIRNSPEISKESWGSFFKLLGRSGPSKHRQGYTPLSSLKSLDLSGNKLGDEACALILELVHDKDSGCNVEQLDLSGNRIGRGTKVVKALRSYIEYYRYSHRVGVAAVQKSWKSTLLTLILAENDLFLGQAAFEIFGLLQHNALCLQSLDLSNNSLEGDYQLLASSLLKNTSLNHLNLSGNKFDGPLIDSILEQINSPDAESGLSFLRFENNSPPLTMSQRSNLSAFLRKSRKIAIERYLKERERALTGEPETNDISFEGTGLEIIDESDTNAPGYRKSFQLNTSRHMGREHEVEDEPDSGDNMITVLFSAPLVFADGQNTLHPFAKLDFEMERELLWQCLKEASRDIEIAFDNAHHSRLLATLTKRCSCLHYSGHGHPNFLPFEDGMGGPNWLSVQDIKELIVRDGVAPFKFVFVSACHSGLAGETFASAGVPHVVCCRQESELKDTAALAFTRQFYLALAVGHTVKESFKQGCKAVRATPNLRDPEQEMEKFVLLPKDGNHDVPVFKAKPVREWPKQPRNQHLMPSKSKRRSSLVRIRSVMGLGAKSSELSVRNMMQEDPSPTPPQFFLGREVDMYYILTAILKMRKRLVSILGKTGVGRSSLACALCHYINERASTISEIHRIYFIKPRQGGRNVSCRSILRQLLDKLEEAGKSRPSDEDTDTEAMLGIICKSLKTDKALIVFDRTELLEKSDEAQELPMILSTLLYETKQVKVLLTGTRPLGQPSIGGQVEHPFNLGPLNFGNTVKLFANLCPHLHTPSERGLLFNKLSGDCEEQAELYPGDRNMNAQTKKTLTMLGDGIPAKIEKAAYSMSKEDLHQMRP